MNLSNIWGYKDFSLNILMISMLNSNNKNKREINGEVLLQIIGYNINYCFCLFL